MRAIGWSLLLAGCFGPLQHPPDGGADLAVSDGGEDDGGVPDLARAGDAFCTFGKFAGFPGSSPTERRFDCACGCTVDNFNGTTIDPEWVVAGQADAMQNQGVQLSAPTGAGNASLASQPGSAPFFLDGDFDLLVDYQVVMTQPQPWALQLDVGSVALVRGHTTSVDLYYVAGGGVTKATTDLSGTLELVRSGQSVRAFANGAMIDQATASGRLAITLAAGGHCDSDGGSCPITLFHALRLARGALVDRSM